MDEFRKPDMPPHVIAVADQELAAINDLIDWLVEWDERQEFFDTLQYDELARVCSFMMSHVLHAAKTGGMLSALTVAVIRLARLTRKDAA